MSRGGGFARQLVARIRAMILPVSEAVISLPCLDITNQVSPSQLRRSVQVQAVQFGHSSRWLSETRHSHGSLFDLVGEARSSYRIFIEGPPKRILVRLTSISCVADLAWRLASPSAID